ncbi:hypothetical protein, partial [Thiolapillus sp.]|uniref:hypothetical protein n=1 Tax=Thiolapillus sp. TaxID=2017437 RepID=UPI003AF4D522
LAQQVRTTQPMAALVIREIRGPTVMDDHAAISRDDPARLTSVSLPRDRFWDIQVSKIDSPTRQPLLPRPSCVRAASPHLRKLGAGYAALPQMTGRDFSYAYFVSPLRYRTPDKQCGPGRYRGLTAFASLSMAVSESIPCSGRCRPVVDDLIQSSGST